MERALLESSQDRIRRLLTAQSNGHSEGPADLLPLVYQRLRALAARYLASESAGNTFQPTDLVHEAYLRLAEGGRIDWNGRTHFYATAATQMRRILVEHARAARRQKRGARPRRITLTENLLRAPALSVDVLGLDEALTRLARRNERQGRVAELRLFSGMLHKEVAHVLGISEATVKLDWRVARAWILKELRLREPAG